MHFFRIKSGTGDWQLGMSGSLARSFRAKQEIFVIRGEGRTLSSHGLTLPTSFTTKSCALHSSLFYFFPFLTTVFASGFASALPRPRLPVFASFFAVMYQAGDLSVHLFCFTVGSFGYCFL